MPSSVTTSPTIGASSSKASISGELHDVTMSHYTSKPSPESGELFPIAGSSLSLLDHNRSRKQVLQLRRSPPSPLNDGSPPLIKKIRREVGRPYVRYCDVIGSEATPFEHTGSDGELGDNEATKEKVTPPVKMVIKTNAGQARAILLDESCHLQPSSCDDLSGKSLLEKVKKPKDQPKTIENGKSNKKAKTNKRKIDEVDKTKENGNTKKAKVKLNSKSKSKSEELVIKPKVVIEKPVKSKKKSAVNLKDKNKKKPGETKSGPKGKSPVKSESSKESKGKKKSVSKSSEANEDVPPNASLENKVIKPKRKRVRKKKIVPPVDLPEIPKSSKSSKSDNSLQYNLLYPRRVVGPIVRVQSANDNKMSKNKKKSKKKESTELETCDKRSNLLFEFSVLNFCDEQSRDQSSSNYSARLKKAKERMATTAAPGQAQLSWLCLFCHLPQNANHLGFLFGPYFLEDAPSDELADLPSTPGKGHSKSAPPPREMWFHEDCYIWSNSLLQCPPITPLHRAQLHYLANTHCAGCQHNGACITCSLPGCVSGSWHYPCAVRAGFQFYEPTFRVYCVTHLDHYMSHFQLPTSKPIATLLQ